MTIDWESEVNVGDLTDAQVIDEVLEATGLKAEFGDEAIAKYGHQVDLVVAREWLTKCVEAEQRHTEYGKASLTIYEFRENLKQIEKLFQKQGLEHWEKEYKENPELLTLYEQESQLQSDVDVTWAASSQATNEAFAISKKLFKPEPKKSKQPKPEKDYSQLVQYWEGKLNSAFYRLTRAKGALETAQKNYDRASGAGREIVEHFHLGMVGGSGKNVRSLNKKKERQGDRLIDAHKQLEAAKRRVSDLESTVKRYQKNLEKASSKAAKQSNVQTPDDVPLTLESLPTFGDWFD